MSKLNYEEIEDAKLVLKEEIYHLNSYFSNEELNQKFLQLKANVCDLNPALVTKSITGTEQDFIMMMDRASDYVELRFSELGESEKNQLLEMFRQCVFGYYVLTPLIESKEVSDIKVLSYDHIVVKANGDRYVSDVKFFDEADYKSWFERILRIHRLGRSDEYALGHCTDRKGVKDFYLRIDVQLSCVTSTEKNNIHIRKMPKTKLSWDYLMENKMLDEDMISYLKNRIGAGYGFLISGRGGSGKSTLLNNMIDLIPFNDQDGGTVTMKANWVDNINPTGIITAGPNNWSAGNGTVTITAQDQGSGLSTFTLNRYSYVTGTWATVSTWNLGGTTASTTKTYTETSEGVFYYSVTIKDVAGNSISASSAAIYLDHSSPVISGHGNTVTAWTSVAPTINVSATDYLSGTNYGGSGVASLVIKDGAGNVVASGTNTARYTLASKYQGTVTWTIVATDNVGHTSTVYVTTKYDCTPPTCSEFSAVPNNWSAGNGTVKFTVQDAWSGISSVVLERYSYVTGTWATVKTWSYSGQTSPVSGTYTETNEGVFYYRLTAKDTLGNTLVKTSAAIYLDHSNPVIYGLNSVVTDWTNVAPVISITTSDYLLGTAYTGSGVKTVVIKDDAGVTVASGSTSASYTLQAKYEGIHTWYVTITDGVGHTSTGSVTTKYDITKPGIDGTEITFVTPDGQTVSGYCQDNIISQHIDDEAVRSVNHPNCTSGLYSVMLYKVKKFETNK